MTQQRLLAAAAALASASVLALAGPADASSLETPRGVAAWRSGSTHVAAVDTAGNPMGVTVQAASRDGRYVAYATSGAVFLRDRVAGTVTQVDLGPDGAQVLGYTGSYVRITPSGRHVFFSTTPYDPTGETDEPQPATGAYRYDRLTGTLVLFEARTTPVAVSDDGAYAATVRYYADGRSESRVTAVGDPGGDWSIPLRNPFPSDPDFVPETRLLDLSGNGQCIVVQSNETAGPLDSNRETDLYVYNRATSTTTLVTAAADGTATGTSAGPADLSDDCSAVAFSVRVGTGGAAVAGTGGVPGSYVRTLASGRTKRVSVDAAGRALAGPLTGMQLSAHARSLVFVTAEPGVVAGDTNGVSDVFLRDLRQRTALRMSVPDRSLRTQARQANGPSLEPQLTRDSRHVFFLSRATNLAPEPFGQTYDAHGLVRTQGRR